MEEDRYHGYRVPKQAMIIATLWYVPILTVLYRCDLEFTLRETQTTTLILTSFSLRGISTWTLGHSRRPTPARSSLASEDGMCADIDRGLILLNWIGTSGSVQVANWLTSLSGLQLHACSQRSREGDKP